MADPTSVPVPLPGEVPFLPQTPEQAAQRDTTAGLVPHAAVVGPPRPVEAPTRMSVGSPVADDALFGALETAHDFITRTTAWKGHEGERQEVLELTAAALQAIAAPVAP